MLNRSKAKIVLAKGLYKMGGLSSRSYEKSYKTTRSVKTEQNISYGNKGKETTLDIYYPDKVVGNIPVMIHIHGGGWALGDKKDARGYCRYVASKGFVTVAINYPLAPQTQHPEMEAIVLEGLKWVSDNISAYHGDANRLFLSGDSAGAHLAAVAVAVCTNDTYRKSLKLNAPLRKEQIGGVILFYGAFDLTTALYSGFPLADVCYDGFLGTQDIKHNRQLIEEASPLNHVTTDYPKCLVMSGEADHLHQSQSVAFSKVLVKHGVQTNTLFFNQTRKDAEHGFMMDFRRKATIESVAAVLSFLKET